MSLTTQQFRDMVHPDTNPAINIWGENDYQNPTSGFLWSEILAKTKDATHNRPVWLSEFGDDRYHCEGPWSVGNDEKVVDHCQRGAGTFPEASYESAADQASWVGGNWNAGNGKDIASHLSAKDADNGAVAGGTAFMWADAWWFSVPGFTGGVTTLIDHDVDGRPDGPWADGVANMEWFGSTLALPDGASGPRITTVTFDRLANEFTGSKGPWVTSFNLDQIGPCSVRATWTTNVATTGRLDYGEWKWLQIGLNRLAADNFLATSSIEDGTFATTHQMTVTGLQALHNYKFYARGFTAAGRPGSYADGIGVRTLPTIVPCP